MSVHVRVTAFAVALLLAPGASIGAAEPGVAPDSTSIEADTSAVATPVGVGTRRARLSAPT